MAHSFGSSIHYIKSPGWYGIDAVNEYWPLFPVKGWLPMRDDLAIEIHGSYRNLEVLFLQMTCHKDLLWGKKTSLKS